MKTLIINRIHKLPLIVLTFLLLGGLPMRGWGQTRGDFTLYNYSFDPDNNENKYVPIYALYDDYGARTEFIIPKADLGSLPTNNYITKITFYGNKADRTVFGTSAIVGMYNYAWGNYSSSSYAYTTTTTVFEGTSLSTNSNGEMEIILSTPFQYTGSNLLISIRGIGGEGSEIRWDGDPFPTDNFQSIYGYSTYGSQGIPTSPSGICHYLPKIKIAYSSSIAPTVTTTNSASGIKADEATVGGTVTNYGGAATTRGICYRTGNSTPTVSNSKTWASGTTSSNNSAYTVSVSNLTSNQLYSYRAMAYNSANSASSPSYASGYSTFTTLASVTTAAVSSLTSTSATLGGSWANGGGASITEYGIVYGTSSNPTTSNTKVKITSGGYSGYSTSVTGLTAGTTYHVRAYVTNAGGTAYGSDVSFETLAALSAPTVSNGSATNITATSATLGGTVDTYGGSATTRGFCYKTGDSSPTVSNTVVWASGTVSANSQNYTVDIPSSGNLTSNQKYSYRACAYNGTNSSSSSPVYASSYSTFTTLATVGTPSVSSITGTSATFTATVNAGGGASITGRGVYWSTSSTAPTGSTSLTSSNSVAAGTNATGEFTVSYSSFSKDTHYYVWSYVRNAGGINFSSSYAEFTTLGWTVNPNTNNVDVSCLASGTSVTLTASTDLDKVSTGLENYKFTTGTSATTYSPTWTSLIASGKDNAVSSVTNIGFTFNYDGVDYTQFSVNSNGRMRLGGTVITTEYHNPFASSYYNSNTPAIAAVGSDCSTGSAGYVKTGLSGSSGSYVRVIEFKLNTTSSTSGTNYITFQIQLFEANNEVRIVYSGYPSTRPSGYQIGLGNASYNKFWYVNPSDNTASYSTTYTSTTYSVNPSGTKRYYSFVPQPVYSWSCISGTSGTASGNTYTASPTQNSTYRVSVTANGTTKTADVTVTITEAAPTGISFSNIEATTATATWTSSASSWKYKLNSGSWTTASSKPVDLTDLTSNTAYTFYVKTNGDCPSAEASSTFTTKAIVSNPTASAITNTAATFSSSVTVGGNATITGRGVYYSTSSTAPTSSTVLNSSNSTAASADTGDFTVTPTFSAGTTYYVWAYVTNAGGTNYSSSYATVTTAYNITYMSGANGSCSGVAYATSGTPVSVTITPDSNYELDALTYTPAGGSATDVTYSGGIYSFTMPAANVTVNATFQSSSFTVTVSSNNTNYGTVTGSGTHTSSVSPEATPTANGYFFKWSDGETTATHSAVSSTTTLTAYFVPKNIGGTTDWTNFIAAVNGTGSYGDGYTYSDQTVTLTADLNSLSGAPVGTSAKPFQGTFNGQGHTITYSNSESVTDKGLFGYVSGSATIHDFVVSATLSGSSTNAGIVVGNMAGGTMYNVAAVGSITAGTNVGGLVGSNAGSIYNCYSNATTLSGTNKGGLAGINTGTIKNCYANGISGSIKAFAYTNTGTIENCYANSVDGITYTDGGGTLSGHGTYDNPKSNIKDKDYMYRDNVVTLASGTISTTYTNGHIASWPGLVSVLNRWVDGNKSGGVDISGLASWFRPLTANINGDLPILGFANATSVGTSGDAKLLDYGGLDALLDGSATNIFLYGNETSVSRVPSGSQHVYVNENAVLKQSGSSDFINTTVGVTFDNSSGNAHDYWGNRLEYDWHLMSTPLSDARIGATYASTPGSYTSSSGVNINGLSGSYFPNSLITEGNPAVGGSIKWDLYTYYEPAYHWLNFKRSKDNHWYSDRNTNIEYTGADQSSDGTAGNFVPGKGYMMAINQNTYMNQTGTLNKGNVTITLTKNDNYSPGANLVGNPYQAYLDLNAVISEHSDITSIYVYDAEMDNYIAYTKEASDNPAVPSRYIHPHQGFFVVAPSNNYDLTFTPAMATAETTIYSYLRGDEVNYPLVNLFAENEAGQRDLAVIEFHRPELGGAEKLDAMRNAPFTLSAHHDRDDYAILFATDDINRVPVHFKTAEDGQMTLTWETYNGQFNSLHLVDNITGVNYDMLTHDSYTFNASTEHYSARFYITYDCSGTGIEENDDNDGASTGSATFAYINNGNIVIDGVETCHGASLQVIDVMGRVMYSTVCTDGVHTVSTNGFAKGVYLLRLADSKQVRVQKIMVP